MSDRPNPFAAHWLIRDTIVSAHIPAAGPGGFVFVGDSIVEGFYGTRLGPYPLINAGYSGIGAEALRPRVLRLVEIAKPRVVALLVGTNDAKQGAWPAGRAAFAGHLDAIAEALAAAPVAPILVTPPPLEAGKRLSGFYSAESLGEIAVVVAQLAERWKCGLVDLHRALAGPDGQAKAGATTDGVHLSPAAYRHLRARLEQVTAGIGPLHDRTVRDASLPEQATAGTDS